MNLIVPLLICVGVVAALYVLAFVLKLGFYAFIIFVILSIPQVRSGIKYLFYK